jgi:hypothetical protein
MLYAKSSPAESVSLASQNIEILAGEAGAGHGRHGPILTRFTRVPIDLVRDMRFVLKEIAFDKEDTVRGAPSGSHTWLLGATVAATIYARLSLQIRA